MDTKFDATTARIDTTNVRIDGLDAKFQAQFDGLRYWSWGTIFAVIAAATATILIIVFYR